MPPLNGRMRHDFPRQPRSPAVRGDKNRHRLRRPGAPGARMAAVAYPKLNTASKQNASIQVRLRRSREVTRLGPAVTCRALAGTCGGGGDERRADSCEPNSACAGGLPEIGGRSLRRSVARCCWSQRSLAPSRRRPVPSLDRTANGTKPATSATSAARALPMTGVWRATSKPKRRATTGSWLNAPRRPAASATAIIKAVTSG